MENVLWISMSVLLFIAAIEDIREKKIHKWLLVLQVVVGIAGGVYFCMGNGSNLWQLSGGLTIGLCMIGFSVMSHGQIGMADGVVIAGLGMLCGARACLIIVSIASVAMAVISILLLVFRKGNKQTCLPFVPALLIGFLIIGWKW